MFSRAVHIEVLEDMTTDAFINAYRRLEAIRGPVSTMFCDQGSNFIGAANELTKELRESLVGRACDFQFNPPNASHFGGLWERQIRCARNILMGILLRTPGRLSTCSLQTLFYEVSSIMNSRPLNPREVTDHTALLLTPEMLLTGKARGSSQPPGDFQPQEAYGRRRSRQVQAMAKQFWKKWSETRGAELQVRPKWTE